MRDEFPTISSFFHQTVSASLRFLLNSAEEEEEEEEEEGHGGQGGELGYLLTHWLFSLFIVQVR